MSRIARTTGDLSYWEHLKYSLKKDLDVFVDTGSAAVVALGTFIPVLLLLIIVVPLAPLILLWTRRNVGKT